MAYQESFPSDTRRGIPLGILVPILLVVCAVLYYTGHLWEIDTILRTCGQWLHAIYSFIASELTSASTQIATFYNAHFRV